jgi:hypothetical protein
MKVPGSAVAADKFSRRCRDTALPQRKLQQTPPWGLFAVVASRPFGVMRPFGAARPLRAARPFWRLLHV